VQDCEENEAVAATASDKVLAAHVAFEEKSTAAQ